LKHDGYRLQIHVRDGRVRLYTINGADWSKCYPLIVEEGLRLNVTAIMDAEVICTDGKGIPTFEMLHSRCNDHLAFACAFDLLMVGGENVRQRLYASCSKLIVAASSTSNTLRITATNCLLPFATSDWKESSQKN
jgi:ATP-dependent DNA ligase